MVLIFTGCGSVGGGTTRASASTPGASPTPTPNSTPSPTPTPTAIPAADHVFVVVLENHAFNQVIGSPFMPYLNSLASAHSLATNYFANTHPSIGNYFMLTTGNIETNNDAFTSTVSSDSIPRAFAAAGKTWKAYMESMPSVGYTGGDVYPYFKHHNPFVYLTDVLNSNAELARVVPYMQLASDLGAGALPNFAFIAPNAEDDAHDCPTGGSACLDTDKLAAADNWLKNNIDPLIKSPALANSVFIIVFDESLDVDVLNGGGKVAMVMAGSHVKAGFKSTTFYQHQSTLRLVLDLLRVSDHPGNSATAATMQEFFQ
ncbi:MAG TPA: alkaline phosphatase family protein [Candidatus Angelobacter sp.]|jgi:acid phosphatase|nr:alkaline phosphatase family protein [Candidatus Angelobacter sp.]